MTTSETPTCRQGDAGRFIDVFALAARQAGCLARRLQREIDLHEKPGHRSPEGAALTPVDLAAQDVVLLPLHAAFPRAAVDAEEETASTQLFRPEETGRPVIVVDPIDGTLNYGEGLSDYAVMGAWIEDGFYRAAVVYFPHHDALYWARQGCGCFRQALGRSPVRAAVEGLATRVLVTSSVPDDGCAALERAGFEVCASRCSAVDATAPVTGRAAAALTVGPPDRRRAVGFLPTLEAGGVVWTGGGWWQGRDPLLLPEGTDLTLVADGRETAARVEQALGGL